jgi:cell division inhibitor SulA
MTTTSNPNDAIASDISALRSQLTALEKSTRLTDIRDAVEDLQTTANSLGQKVAKLRSRGFVFGKDFESQAAHFSRQWMQMGPGILSQINQQASRLQTAFAPLQSRSPSLAAASGNPMQARPLLKQLKPQADALESQVRAAEGQLKGMYDSFESQLRHFNGQLSEADSTLTQLEEATFKLLATEAGVRTVKAVWVRDGREDKEDPDGILFLTDQRLIFEQKEEVATKKVLFITTEKQKIQKVLFDAPVALVEAVNVSKQGLFKNEDNLEILFAPSAPIDKVRFHIWQEGVEWQALINRVQTRDIDKERAVAVDAGAEAKVKSAPSQCPSCGGNISQVILRGQDSIKCEFCGAVIRL